MGDIKPTEGLWRGVFSSRQARLARGGKVNHRRVANAFQESKHAMEISVDRFR